VPKDSVDEVLDQRRIEGTLYDLGADQLILADGGYEGHRVLLTSTFRFPGRQLQ
jgi:hypothetical protein